MANAQDPGLGNVTPGAPGGNEDIRKQFEIPSDLEGMLELLQRRYPATHAPQNEELGRKILVALVGKVGDLEVSIAALESRWAT